MSDFRLCNRLKVARAERSLSQEQLALLAGVTRQTISSIETGQYNPSALLALTLALRLNKRVAATARRFSLSAAPAAPGLRCDEPAGAWL